MNKLRFFYLIGLLLSIGNVWGQCLPQQDNPDLILNQNNGTEFEFKQPLAATPPAPAPGIEFEPFWSFFWEFGDGTFARYNRVDSTLTHAFPPNGEFAVRSISGPVYSQSTHPPVDRVVVISDGAGSPPTIMPPILPASNFGQDDLRVGAHWEGTVMTGDQLVAIVTTRQQGTTGHLSFFYNSNKVGLCPGTTISDYNKEELISEAELPESAQGHLGYFEGNYGLNEAIHMELPPQRRLGEQHVFIDLKVTEMLEEADDEVMYLAAVYYDPIIEVPDTFVFATGIGNVRDPNYMWPVPNYIMPEDLGKRIHYTIRFQNVGSAATSVIRVRAEMDSALLGDIQPGEAVLANQPLGVQAPDGIEAGLDGKFYVTWTFNFPLPGTGSPGLIDASYTYGTISFSTTNKQVHPIGTKLKGQAFVKFDAVDEVATNIATVHVGERPGKVPVNPGGGDDSDDLGGLPYWCWLLIAILIILILVWLAWQVFSED